MVARNQDISSIIVLIGRTKGKNQRDLTSRALHLRGKEWFAIIAKNQVTEPMTAKTRIRRSTKSRRPKEGSSHALVVENKATLLQIAQNGRDPIMMEKIRATVSQFATTARKKGTSPTSVPTIEGTPRSKTWNKGKNHVQSVVLKADTRKARTVQAKRKERRLHLHSKRRMTDLWLYYNMDSVIINGEEPKLLQLIVWF